MSAQTRPPEIPRTLVVTADFPPTVGGVQQYVHGLVHHLPPERVSVLTGTHEGWETSDAEHAFRVLRSPGKWLWPGRNVWRFLPCAFRAS